MNMQNINIKCDEDYKDLIKWLVPHIKQSRIEHPYLSIDDIVRSVVAGVCIEIDTLHSMNMQVFAGIIGSCSNLDRHNQELHQLMGVDKLTVTELVRELAFMVLTEDVKREYNRIMEQWRIKSTTDTADNELIQSDTAVTAIVDEPTNFRSNPLSALIYEAADTVTARGVGYDKDKERSMERTVAAFNALTGHNLTTFDGWQFMQLLKQVRGRSRINKDDFIDLIGYTALAAEERGVL